MIYLRILTLIFAFVVLVICIKNVKKLHELEKTLSDRVLSPKSVEHQKLDPNKCDEGSAELQKLKITKKIRILCSKLDYLMENIRSIEGAIEILNMNYGTEASIRIYPIGSYGGYDVSCHFRLDKRDTIEMLNQIKESYESDLKKYESELIKAFDGSDEGGSLYESKGKAEEQTL